MINKDKVIETLNMKPFGAKGWFQSADIQCNNCGTVEKFGILFTSKGGTVHCFKCNNTISLNKYLKTIGRSDLIQYERNFSLYNNLPSLIDEKEEISLSVPKINYPIGYKRIYYDEYLDQRGFEPSDYNKFNVGICSERKLENYLVFLIKDNQNNVNAWLARSKHSKDWHKNNLKEYKEGKTYLRLRYENSPGTDFSRLLLGENEITQNTHTVYITEGLFDKQNVDKQLGLDNQEEIVCVVSFGNSLTIDQQQILINKGVENLVFLWDNGTISSSQRTSMKISKYFKSIKVCEFKSKDVDAGDSTKEELENNLKNSVDYFYFYKNRIGEINLKL